MEWKPFGGEGNTDLINEHQNTLKERNNGKYVK